MNTDTFEKSRRISIFFGAGSKQTNPAEGSNYFICVLMADHNWMLTPKSGIGLGPDVFFDNSIPKKLKQEQEQTTDALDKFRAGFHGGYELVIGDVSLQLQMGAYVFSRYTKDGSLYHRLALRYRINERLFAGLQLKTHWGKADFIETGIGYSITKTRKK